MAATAAAPTLAAMKVMVGFDGSPASRDAMVLGEALCAATDGELMVPTIEARNDRAAAERMQELAATEKADVIVVGSAKHGRCGHVLPGSFGERILSDCPCAVAIAPLELAERGLELREIAIAYDGSLAAGEALRTAIDLAQRTGASLLVLGAADPAIDTTGMQSMATIELEATRMQRHLARALQTVPAGVTAHARLLHGAPNHVIGEAAADADLLVLGSRGHYGVLRRLFLGSVSAHATRDASCATLIALPG
jgi:nucleotide-binding universal stress UspA family protein